MKYRKWYIDVCYIVKIFVACNICTSLEKEVICMFLGALVCLFVCLSASLPLCKQHYSKGYEWIAMTFYGGV